MTKRKIDEISDSGSDNYESSESSESSESEQDDFTYPIPRIRLSGPPGSEGPPDIEMMRILARSMVKILFPGATEKIKEKFENIIQNLDLEASEEDILEENIDILDVLGDYADEILPMMVEEVLKNKHKYLASLKKERPDLLKIYHRSMIKFRKITNLMIKDIRKSENFVLKERSRRKRRKTDSDEEL